MRNKTLKNRREFLEFMGYSTAGLAALSLLPACASKIADPGPPLPIRPLGPLSLDQLSLAEGFQSQILLRWGDSLNSKGQRFGYNNDYIAYIPLDPRNPHEGLMWVNHESVDPKLINGWEKGKPRTLAQVDQERREVGGSIVHVRKLEGQWKVVANSRYNRRLDGTTKIPLIAPRDIQGTRVATGTLGNCAGGVTPWGTVLTCEENYQEFYAEAVYRDGKREIIDWESSHPWWGHYPLPPEHYGWVVEVNLRTGAAKKLTALGRFCHECATTIVASNGCTVVYSGDDSENEHLYKFIASKPGSLETGKLFVADTESGKWLALDRDKDERLRKAFKDDTEMLIRAREAAKIVGATPLDRPEDIEIDPATRAVLVTLTNNKSKKNFHGSIMRLMEKNGDPLSMTFDISTFMTGGPGSGFSCPDNMVFDRKGNLWLCTDISGKSLGQEPYQSFGHNGLFYIPMSGASAGRAFQVASAPAGAEFTGPCFSSDGHTLFLSVQHPGEGTTDRKNPISHWPNGGKSKPMPCVVAISGRSLDLLVTAN